jgi:hypothetical protein
MVAGRPDDSQVTAHVGGVCAPSVETATLARQELEGKLASREAHQRFQSGAIYLSIHLSIYLSIGCRCAAGRGHLSEA